MVNIKKVVVLIFVVFCGSSTAQESNRVNFGMLVMVGGRYDDMRMCVATPAGVKGGPIADVMFRVCYNFSERFGAGIEVPVMRPLLFGVAFKMLQFEPQVVFEYAVPGDKGTYIAAPAIGASFHYGPDYMSDKKDRDSSFFAIGPIVGIRGGIKFKDQSDKFTNEFAVRPFFISLFSKEHGRGTVIGGAAEYIRSF